MKHIAAYLLLGVGGNSDPSASDIKGVLESVGIEADNDRLESLLKELKGKDISELISQGSEKLASVPSGGGAAPAAGAAAGGAAAAEEAPAAKEEEKEESDDDMGFGLFD